MSVKYTSEIPYDSVTDNQVELSTESSLESLYRTIRDGSDNILVEYPKENSGAFNAYEQLTDSLDTLRLKSAYNNLGLNESRLVEIRSTDIELNNNGNIAFNGEITDVIIISGGVGYTAGELYTEDTYGSGFKATYTVDKTGKIDSITVINSGLGYVNPPTLLFTNSKNTSTAILIPIMSASADTNNKLVLPLKMSLIDTDRVNSTMTISGSLLPSANELYNLGSLEAKWNSLYLKRSSLYLGDNKISVEDSELRFTDDTGKIKNVIGRETGTSDDAGASNNQVTKIGKDNTADAQGYLALGSGNSDLGGMITGAISLARTDQSGYLGLRILSASPTDKKQYTLGAAMTSPFTAHRVAIGCFSAAASESIGGFIDISECALDPPAAPPAGSITLYAKSDGLYVYQDSAVKNLSAMLPLAGGDMTGDLKITKTATQLTLAYDGSNEARFLTGSTGGLSISTVGSGTTDSDLTLDADGTITLDAANGRFIAKNAGTQFSVANSAYAGMILGYTTVGIDVADDSYTLSTTMTTIHDHLKVKFVAPPSGVVEIFAQIYFDASRRLPVLGLSDQNATAGYQAISFPNATDVTNEHVQATPPSSAGDTLLQPHWVVIGLTPGTAYEWWIGAKTTGGSGGVLKWGGNATNEYPPFIMKATALPTAVADFAVYG